MHPITHPKPPSISSRSFNCLSASRDLIHMMQAHARPCLLTSRQAISILPGCLSTKGKLPSFLLLYLLFSIATLKMLSNWSLKSGNRFHSIANSFSGLTHCKRPISTSITGASDPSKISLFLSFFSSTSTFGAAFDHN